MAVMKCEKNMDRAQLARAEGQVFPCYDPKHTLHDIREQCRQPIMITPILSNEPVTFPQNVGISIDPSDMAYFIFEFHVGNPTKNDLEASVAIRIWLTSKLI